MLLFLGLQFNSKFLSLVLMLALTLWSVLLGGKRMICFVPLGMPCNFFFFLLKAEHDVLGNGNWGL